MNAQEAIEIVEQQRDDLSELIHKIEADYSKSRLRESREEVEALSIVLESAKKFEEIQKDNEANLKLWMDEHNNEPKNIIKEDKHKYYEVDGMILKDDESNFSIDEFLNTVLEQGYHIAGEFKSFNEEGADE